MNNRKLLYFLLPHTILITIICLWCFFGDIYFGYELGDILIIFSIFAFTVLSILFLFNYKAMSKLFIQPLVIFSIIGDICILYLFFNRYW